MSVYNERDWAAKTAMRLRIVQEAIAESESDGEEDRGTIVWQFIADAMGELADVDERSRANSLRLLDEEFPFYQDRVVIQNSDHAVHPPSETGAKVTDDKTRTSPTPQDIVQDLLKAAGGMKEEERAEIAEQLVAAGFQVTAPIALTPDEQSKLPVSMPAFHEEVSRLAKTVDKIKSTLGVAHVTEGGGPSI